MVKQIILSSDISLPFIIWSHIFKMWHVFVGRNIYNGMGKYQTVTTRCQYINKIDVKDREKLTKKRPFVFFKGRLVIDVVRSWGWYRKSWRSEIKKIGREKKMIDVIIFKVFIFKFKLQVITFFFLIILLVILISWIFEIEKNK